MHDDAAEAVVRAWRRDDDRLALALARAAFAQHRWVVAREMIAMGVSRVRVAAPKVPADAVDARRTSAACMDRRCALRALMPINVFRWQPA